LAKGTLKIAEKCGVATAIFLRGQEENEGLGLKRMLGRMLIWFTLLFTLSLGLFIGLVKMHKELR
jgi:hypothetical protein